MPRDSSDARRHWSAEACGNHQTYGRPSPRFAQSSRTVAASAGGLGIGLAVVRAIAQSHGGTVSATSPGPGEGSEFTLRLPIVTSGGAFFGNLQVESTIAVQPMR
ncbi:ATP-binding protein [Paraburkholderia sediminicola]